jgi:hypothetical protein
MANTILIKRKTTTGAPFPASLLTGEMCLVVPDKQVYIKNGDGTVTLLNGSGGGGSVNYTEVLLDFGTIINKTNNKTFFVADVNVLTTSKVLVAVSGQPTDDHSSDEIILMDVSVFATNIQEAIGFNIAAISPQKVYGKIKVNYLITN